MTIVDYDVETTGFQAWSGKQKAFLFQFFDPEVGAAEALFPGEDDARIQWWFNRGEQVGLRAWNTRFDRAFGDVSGFTIPGDGQWHDGMLIAQIIDERRSAALKSVGETLFGEDAKSKQKEVKAWLTAERANRKKAATEAGEELVEPNYGDVPRELMVPYGLEDVYLTRKVCDNYAPVLEQTPELAEFYQFERKVSDALYAVEKRGLPADQKAYRQLENEVINNLDELEDNAIKLAQEGTEIKEFNPKSTAHILDALKQRGADMSFMETSDGEVKSADRENLEAVDDDLAKAVLRFRAEFKVLSTYVRPMIGRHYDAGLRMHYEPFIAPDDRIHASYRQAGARTGRMSCVAEGSLVDAPRDLLRYPNGIPIEKITAGTEVYSFDAQGVPHPKKVLRVLNQGQKPVLRLVWRAAGNKSYLGELKATADHRIRLRDGTYKELRHLKAGDQLAFLSRQVTGDGYARICWKHGSGDGVPSAIDEHRHLCPNAEVSHHRNENKLDNSTTNLQSMTVVEHNKHHNPEGPRPERNKSCPYSPDALQHLAQHGITWCIRNLHHDHTTIRRWCDEYEISIPDTRSAVTNHVVVAIMDDGEDAATYDLQIEGTPNFVVNEIGVHNCSNPNIQNQPRDDLRLRYNIRAEEGHKLVCCDLSNIEMRLFAAYAGEGRLLDAVREGADLHTMTAELIGIKDKIRTGGEIESARQRGKTYNFSIVYGGGLRTVRRQLHVDQAQARLLRKRYYDAYPEIENLQHRIQFRLEDQGYIKDLWGRRYRCWDARKEAYKFVNYLIQGTAAQVLKDALISLHEDGVPVVALVHDEVVAHPLAADALEVEQLIIKRLTQQAQPGGRLWVNGKAIVPLEADGCIVDRWSDAKPLKDGSLFVPNWARR